MEENLKPYENFCILAKICKCEDFIVINRHVGFIYENILISIYILEALKSRCLIIITWFERLWIFDNEKKID